MSTLVTASRSQAYELVVELRLALVTLAGRVAALEQPAPAAEPEPEYQGPQTGEPLTIEEARTAWKVSRRTVYNWIAAKKVVVVRTPGGAPRVVWPS